MAEKWRRPTLFCGEWSQEIHPTGNHRLGEEQTGGQMIDRTRLRITLPDYSSPKTKKAGKELQQRADNLHKNHEALRDARHAIENAPLTDSVDPTGINLQYDELLRSELQLRYDTREYFPLVEADRRKELQACNKQLEDKQNELQSELERIGWNDEILKGLATLNHLIRRHPAVGQLEKNVSRLNGDTIRSMKQQNEEQIAVVEAEIRRRRSQ